MMQPNKYFYLFADCIPVKGANRSVICDLGRQDIYFIPNTLYDILEKTFIWKLDKVIKHFKLNKENEILLNYFQFLIDSELGVWVDEISSFPRITEEWFSPSIISNAIIDIRNKKHDFQSIFNQLESLGCEDVQIRYYTPALLKNIDEIMSFLTKSSIKGVEFILPYSKELEDESKLIKITEKFRRISVIYVHSSPRTKIVSHEKFVRTSGMSRIYYLTQSINSPTCCGIIKEKGFSYELVQDFMENKLFNSCLNKKISIDENGYIKNCPSMVNDYGCIGDTSLNEVSKNEDFLKYSKISKDSIDVCKKCEFRYICTDCRAYIEEPKNLFSKPLKCGYNPDTNTWEDWSQNPLKKKAIKYYKMNVSE